MNAVVSKAGELDVLTRFSMHIRFITDRCVAARVEARDEPEWPPHPGRFYMALAATYFETDGPSADKAAEQRALEWLATLPAPSLIAADAGARATIAFYVPVNPEDRTPETSTLQSAPGMPRLRQPRAFPTVVPPRDAGQGAADVTFEWLDAPSSSEHLPALDRLCRNVIRIGHSSSFVMAWAEIGPRIDYEEWWEPTATAAEMTCRVAASGELDRLKTLCQSDRIDLFAALKTEIDSTEGKPHKAAKARFAEVFGEPYKKNIRPPEPTPATLGVWQGYRRARVGRGDVHAIVENQYFDRNLILLAKGDGPVLNVERTLCLTGALRKALIAVHGSVPMPAWLSGHDPDGTPTSSPHAAFFPIPFVGFPHADGHIMGLAMALPKGVSIAERARWLGPLLVNQESGESADPKLALWGSDLPKWTLQLEERPSPPRMLRNETWTSPATTWASVTPVVLDRFPKASRTEDRKTWHAEVVEIIEQACTRGGLPTPAQVDIDSTAWHEGVPRAWAKTRRLHAHSPSRTAPLGDGFPSMDVKRSRPAKPQVHVWLRFATKVAGPVLIGAGRFAGYGLCMPLRSHEMNDSSEQ